MKLLVVTLVSLSLLASASAQSSQASAVSVMVQDSQMIKINRRGSEPSRPGPAENFTGSVRIDPLFQPNAPARTSGSLVTFESGARTAWHTHPLGQVLIVTRALAECSVGATRSMKSGRGTWSGFHPVRSTGTGSAEQFDGAHCHRGTAQQ